MFWNATTGVVDNTREDCQLAAVSRSGEAGKPGAERVGERLSSDDVRTLCDLCRGRIGTSRSSGGLRNTTTAGSPRQRFGMQPRAMDTDPLTAGGKPGVDNSNSNFKYVFET
jgi:hypothetical protein